MRTTIVSDGSSRGIALIAVLLVSSLVFVMALGLSLVVSVNQLAVRNHRESAALAAAAIAGVELAAATLASVADWNAVLAGTLHDPTSDGPPSGQRRVDGGRELDLAPLTNLLNCGVPGTCSAARLAAVTADRPWGANNPTWRLFLFGPLSSFASFRFPPAIYILVWVGDDGREADGDPESDGGGPAQRGGGVLRVHATAFGRDFGRRAVEAELVRVCRPLSGEPPCLPGVRIQTLHDLRVSLP
jgi:hypothetical protein